jgi:hypothetical protein
MIAISGAKVGSEREKPYFCARNRDHDERVNAEKIDLDICSCLREAR